MFLSVYYVYIPKSYFKICGESTSETLAFFLLLFFPPEGKHLLKYFEAIVLLFLSKPVWYEIVRFHIHIKIVYLLPFNNCIRIETSMSTWSS